MSKSKFIIPIAVIAVAGLLYLGIALYITAQIKNQIDAVATALNAQDVKWESADLSLFSRSVSVSHLTLTGVDTPIGKATLYIAELQPGIGSGSDLTFHDVEVAFLDAHPGWDRVKADTLTLTGERLHATQLGIYGLSDSETPDTQIDALTIERQQDEAGSLFSLNAEHVVDMEMNHKAREMNIRSADDPMIAADLAFSMRYSTETRQYVFEYALESPQLLEATASLILNQADDPQTLLTLYMGRSDLTLADFGKLMAIEPGHFRLDLHDHGGKAIRLHEKTGKDAVSLSEFDAAELCGEGSQLALKALGEERCMTVTKWLTGNSNGFIVDIKPTAPVTLLDILSIPFESLLENLDITIEER